MGAIRVSRRVILIAAAFAALVLLALSSYGGYKWWQQATKYETFANVDMQEFDLGGDRAMVLTPEHPNGTVALVMHGSGGDEQMPRVDYMRDFTRSLLNDGWTVASANASGEQWGSEVSQEDYLRLAEHMVREANAERIVIVSFSMGAVAGLNLVADGAVPNLAGWVGVNPVVDINAAHEDARYTDLIDAALTPQERNAVNPAGLDLTAVSVPLLVYSGDADTAMPTALHADVLARIADIGVQTCAGSHLSTDCFRANEVIDRFG